MEHERHIVQTEFCYIARGSAVCGNDVRNRQVYGIFVRTSVRHGDRDLRQRQGYNDPLRHYACYEVNRYDAKYEKAAA